MVKKCEKCGKELKEQYVIEPGLGQVCHNCYLDHVLFETNSTFTGNQSQPEHVVKN